MIDVKYSERIILDKKDWFNRLIDIRALLLLRNNISLLERYFNNILLFKFAFLLESYKYKKIDLAGYEAFCTEVSVPLIFQRSTC